MIDVEVRHALERIDADSWEELCRNVPHDLAQTMKLTVERQDDVVITHCLAADAPLNNRAIALGIGKPCTREQILDLAKRFIATGMKNFALQVSPYARPAQLEDWLAEAGLVVRSHGVKLVRDNADPVSLPTTRVVKIGTGEATMFGELSAHGWGRPPIVGPWMASTVGLPKWHHYIGYDGQLPAGVAAMYIDGDYAWLGIGSTLAEHRQRGVQTSLIAQRIIDGLEQGVRHFIAETVSFNTSCKNLMQAGFTCAYERPNYGIPIA